MKRINILIAATMTACAVIAGSCNKVLDENPEASIVPAFFNTQAGVLGGITAVYGDIRAAWGTEGFSAEMVAGTDEHLAGASASSIQLYTYNGLTASTAFGWWNTAYTDINSLNGVLQYGASLNIDTATKSQYLAQAKFLRGFWYFHLVQAFGDIPLHTTFITVPSQADSRQATADVYTQIIKDFTDASVSLPNTAVAPFSNKAATKPVALYYLAKAYLTRGWLNNTAADFTQAYNICQQIIASKATYGLDLWQNYGDAFVPANDYGKETMFVSDHIADTKYGDNYQVGGAQAGGVGLNLTPWFYIWNYPATSGINSYKNASGALTNNGTSGMLRDAANGRPFIRTRPNNDASPSASGRYVLDQAFADRINDSRYDNTFQQAWIANQATTNTSGASNNLRGISYTLNVGDTAVWMPSTEVAGAPQFNGATPFKGIIIPPSLWTNVYFPSVKKFMDPSRGTNFNDPSTRPVVILRFSDVYLLGAEAAFKAGDVTNAAALMNVVRQRAAYRPSNSAAQNSAAVLSQTVTPAQITLDFILDERTREFYGEWQRWFDLVRTRTLITRVTKWNKEAAPYIKPFHILRPIPQSQIDRVTQGPAFPQNPGY